MLQVNLWLSINSSEEHSGISLFPSPASNVVNLYSSQPFEENATIQAVDITGRVVIEQNVVQGEQHAVIDICGLANGMYFVQVNNGTSMTSDKLIINR